MKRIAIGKTGIEVNKLGFGGIPIQTVDEDQAISTVLHAVERGIDFIDTSRMYTTSERRIGKALQQTEKRVILASKSVQRTKDGIRQDLNTSMGELQRGYIDIYQCHFVNDDQTYEQVISPGGALEGLKMAKEEGLIGHIGISSHSLDLFDRILDDGLFETIMVCYSFLEPAAMDKIIPKAIENEVGIFAMKPFSGGVIENIELALKYVLSQDEILALAGVERTDFFDQNWEIFQGNYELSRAERIEIEEIIKNQDKVFCRRCDYCQPCTEEIPIQMILGIRSMAKRMGKDILKGRHKDGIEKARNCTECGECMERCPYHLPIPELIKKNIQWVDEQLEAL